MPNTPPNSGKTPGESPKASVQQQLDDLLVKIETEEPGTVDPGALPRSFRPKQIPSETAEAPGPADESAQQAAPQAQADISPQAPAQPDPTEDQAEMLAALNSALQEINPGSEQDSAPDTDAQTTEPETATPDTAQTLSPEDQLQQEIAAIIDSEPQVSAEAPVENSAPTGGNELSTEDQIAMEIEGLLNADHPEAPEPTAAPEQEQQPVDETSIDELDQMLASEIDDDDELLGDFHTVEAITAGIEPAEAAALTAEDAHAATARDVAAELDTQPEDFVSPENLEPAPDEDPLAALEEIAQTVEKNEKAYQAQVRLSLPAWVRHLEDARERLLSVCYVLNWPARRFLTTEWRANLGYIALLNLFFGVGIWLYLIVR